MPDTPSITLVKRFDYRGTDEEWSNTYHFTNPNPDDEAAWRELGLAIYETERAILRTDVVLVQLYGYDAGNNISVAQIDLRVGDDSLLPGTLAASGSYPTSGDQAVRARARCGTDSRGHKTYCSKYWHGSYKASTGTGDTASTGAVAAMTAHLAALLDGSLPGGAKWCGPQEQNLTVPHVDPYVTTRTLKRRGKRP